MAESGLSATINTLRLDVGLRHGWGRSVAALTATQLADFDNISKRALREFYYPAIDPGTPYYEWGFLRKAAQITLVTNTAAYDLPDDFGGTILDDSVTYASGVSHPSLLKVPESTIRKQQSQDSTSTGWPAYFAVRNKTHAPTTGQRWELLTYQTPGLTQNTVVLDYRYVYVPDAISNTNIYPAGGAQFSEVVTAAHLAAAELVLDGDPAGPYRQQFVAMLATAVRNDLNQKANQPDGGAA